MKAEPVSYPGLRSPLEPRAQDLGVAVFGQPFTEAAEQKGSRAGLSPVAL